MKDITKQPTGFRFGQHKLTVLRHFGDVQHNGRTYKVVKVQTQDELDYISVRLYNAKGKFIKQILMEPEVAPKIGGLLAYTSLEEPA